MPEFVVDVEFDVYCGTCGAALCPQSRTIDYQRGHGGQARAVHVEACEKCMDAARSKGYDEGYSERDSEGEGNG